MGFIKKCKTSLGADAEPQILKDIKQLKLEKYITEIAPAVFEGLLRCKTAADVASAINIISSLHTRFPDTFTPQLASILVKSLAAPSSKHLASLTPEQREKDEQTRISKQRVLLRVVGEMYLSGLFWGIDTQPDGIGGIKSSIGLKNLAGESGASKSTGSAATVSLSALQVKDVLAQPGFSLFYGTLYGMCDHEQHHNAQLYMALLKYFANDLALPEHASIEESVASIVLEDGVRVVTQEQCNLLKSLVDRYYSTMSKRLVKMHNILRKLERRNEERLFNRGQLHEEAQEKQKRWATVFERFNEQVTFVSEQLGKPLLELPEEDEENKLNINFGAANVGGNKDGSSLANTP
ncbi:mRNA decay protein, partial [Spiromyces aspiralis]